MNTKKRLIFVSNRLPVTVSKEDGKIKYKRSLGGLAIGLSSFHKDHNSIWIGWPGISMDSIKDEKEEIENELISKFDCYPVFLDKDDIDNYYAGFCNKTIWPLFHYFTQYTTFDDELWEVYRLVNKKFHKVLLQISGPNDMIWIQDYHLMLLPSLIRGSIPDALVGFFLHIPFPSYELFRLLPWRNEILKGLLGSDLIGFHTYDYERHFLSSVHRILGLELKMNKIDFQGRTIQADCFPMGIDYKKYHEKAQDSKTLKQIQKIRKETGDRKIILSLDRMDYTKGILQRLEAYELFLEKYPDYKEKVILIFVIAPSRSKVEEYQILKSDIDELVGKINGRFGTIKWNPILYIHRPLPFERLIALYRISDVALITPIRDGMNLIAKEYITSKVKGNGVLILSETAGAAKELYETIIINTNNREQIVYAIKEAIEMPDDSKKKKIHKMQKRIKNYDVTRWAEDFIENLIQTNYISQDKALKIFTSQGKKNLIKNYKKSKKRLIILDYDGTLIKFFKKPKHAEPNDEILFILKKIASDRRNKIILISGRDKNTIDEWFNELNIDLIAEHGLWTKKKEKEWEMFESLRNDWKDTIRPILEKYIYRTPGSFIEEKEYSLAWHYRKTETELGDIRSRELINILENHCYNMDLNVLDGNKVVEIKNSQINKGRAISQILTKKKWDFILIMGDDTTDEDMFEIAPENAYSIRVGLERTSAKYNLFSVKESRNLIREIIESIE
ncbi:MAG: bifunctional alpha,alpha-trehalose-phosphate synthase (UDP-forming)/trehalose-phosphatase [Candidatus Hodarchaeota archaeon]